MGSESPDMDEAPEVLFRQIPHERIGFGAEINGIYFNLGILVRLGDDP